MAIPVPRNWSTGEMGTAALLNTHIRDALEFFVTPPWCWVTSSANQSISNTTWTTLTWDTQLVDSDNMMALGTETVMTVRTPGCYAIHAQIMYAADVDGVRGLTCDRIRGGARTTLVRGGQRAADGTGTPSQETAFQIATYAELEIGDQLDFWTWQNSGGALNALRSSSDFYTWASARWIGSL